MTHHLMKHISLTLTLLTIVILSLIVLFIGHHIREREPILLQGIADCRTFKAASKIPGRIERIYVNEGDTVTMGELLYLLSTPELSAKLTQAQALRSAAVALDQQVLRGARSQQIEAALNLWQEAQAGRELATKSYERAQNLYREGVITAQKFDEAKASYNSMRAVESAAKAQYSLVLAGADRQEREAAAAQVRGADGGVAEVEAYLHDALVYAPYSGIISTIAYEAGEVVGSGYPVITILDVSDMWILFNIRENLLPQFQLGDTLSAWIPALERHLPLRIGNIDVEADFATWSATRTRGDFDLRTFGVKMYPTEHNTGLRPGMSAIIKELKQ